ncbi:hypothetical protein K488DRAFT_8421, partial [Vararia minispora EC-137]
PPAPDILQTFDPLVSAEEKAARDAWANPEGHPPPHSLPAKSEWMAGPSTVPPSEAETHGSSNPFPAISSLARSLTLSNMNINTLVAGKGRSRPQSMDSATIIQTPTPSSASSFAVQQDRARSNLGGFGSFRSQGPVRKEGTASRSSNRGTKDVDPPFDFQRFLDQMKQKSAEPVAKYLRSFLSNFTKRTFTIADQVKLINDFLSFISQKMREVEPWRHASDAEFDNAMEGMEKLVMNRLYDYIFTPQVARAVPPRPITADDLERDRVLAQRIALFGWIEPRHLDVPVADGTNGFLMFAQQVELIKVNHYKAPRDKLICILNCCKVIFGLIRHLNSDESADTFIPILIFVVLKANPDNLLSNVEFINRFRNPEKLQSEAGYYLSSLMGAVSFIETMDHTSLSQITQEEFESNVEAAIQTLPTSRPQSPPISSSSSSSSSLPVPTSLPLTQQGKIEVVSGPLQSSSHVGEEPATPLSLPSIDAKKFLQRTGDSISKPLSAIGRIFSEALDGAEDMLSAHLPSAPGVAAATPAVQSGAWVPPTAMQTPYKPRIRRTPNHSPAGSYTDETPSRSSRPMAPQPQLPQSAVPPSLMVQSNPASRAATPGVDIDIAGLQEEIDRAHERQVDAARGTLEQIFPAMDREVIEWVLEANEGDLGKSIEALLEMSSG